MFFLSNDVSKLLFFLLMNISSNLSNKSLGRCSGCRSTSSMRSATAMRSFKARSSSGASSKPSSNICSKLSSICSKLSSSGCSKSSSYSKPRETHNYHYHYNRGSSFRQGYYDDYEENSFTRGIRTLWNIIKLFLYCIFCLPIKICYHTLRWIIVWMFEIENKDLKQSEESKNLPSPITPDPAL